MKKIATAAVIWKDKKILIAQRAKDEYWEFPGGKLDLGETPEECIVREIQEELSIDIKIGESFETVKGSYRGQDMILYGFHALWIGGELQLNVHLDACLVNVDELLSYTFVEEDLEIRRQIEDEERHRKFLSKQ